MPLPKGDKVLARPNNRSPDRPKISPPFSAIFFFIAKPTHKKHKEIPFKSFVSLIFFIYCVTWRDITLSNGIYIHTIEAASAHCCPWRFIRRELTGKKETFRVVWTKRGGGLTDDREKSMEKSMAGWKYKHVEAIKSQKKRKNQKIIT